VKSWIRHGRPDPIHFPDGFNVRISPRRYSGSERTRNSSTSMLQVGAVARTSNPDEFAAFIANDYVKWQQLISRVGIKNE